MICKPSSSWWRRPWAKKNPAQARGTGSLACLSRRRGERSERGPFGVPRGHRLECAAAPRGRHRGRADQRRRARLRDEREKETRERKREKRKRERVPLLIQRERSEDDVQSDQRPALEGSRPTVAGHLPEGQRGETQSADVDW